MSMHIEIDFKYEKEKLIKELNELKNQQEKLRLEKKFYEELLDILKKVG